MKHSKRTTRTWVYNAISCYGARHDNPHIWDYYLERLDGNRSHILTVEQLRSGKVLVTAQNNHVLFRYNSLADLEDCTKIMQFIATQPSWWLHGWRSKDHRRRRRAQIKSENQRSRARLRNEFNAAFKGPRWNSLPADYVSIIHKSEVRYGLRSWAKRLRHALRQQPITKTQFIVDEFVYGGDPFFERSAPTGAP